MWATIERRRRGIFVAPGLSRFEPAKRATDLIEIAIAVAPPGLGLNLRMIPGLTPGATNPSLSSMVR
jgi:hypothetical protein